MRKGELSEEQIIAILREQEATPFCGSSRFDRWRTPHNSRGLPPTCLRSPAAKSTQLHEGASVK